MYSLKGYLLMLADRKRIEAYAASVRASVKPGMVVCDLGTGQGLFAMLSARLGAKVYAVEASPVIYVAREMARLHNLDRAITFFHAPSEKVELPEKVDLIISDLRGILPFFKNHIPTLMDVEKRWLAPGGHFVCQRDDLFCGVIEEPRLWNELTSMLQEPILGFDFSALIPRVTQQGQKIPELAAAAMLSNAGKLFSLDYNNLSMTKPVGQVDLKVQKPGTGHGFAVWFDAYLLHGEGFSNAPGAETIYRQMFFPWPRPVKFSGGEMISAKVRAVEAGGDYQWLWESKIQSPDGSVLAEFRQSTFGARLLDLDFLHRQSESFSPVPTEEMAIRAFILKLVDGTKTVIEIAAEVERAFPQVFPNRNLALKKVQETLL